MLPFRHCQSGKTSVHSSDLHVHFASNRGYDCLTQFFLRFWFLKLGLLRCSSHTVKRTLFKGAV